jgi:hypothetical protein
MPWVRFTGDFDFKPKASVTLAYRSGEVKMVTTACARKAISRGKAEKVSKPNAKQ